MLDRNLGNGLLHYISVAAATAGDNTLVTWALQNSNLSVPAGLFLGIYLFNPSHELTSVCRRSSRPAERALRLGLWVYYIIRPSYQYSLC